MRGSRKFCQRGSNFDNFIPTLLSLLLIRNELLESKDSTEVRVGTVQLVESDDVTTQNDIIQCSKFAPTGRSRYGMG